MRKKPETAAAILKRQNNYTEARKSEGLVRVCEWVPAGRKQELRDAAWVMRATDGKPLPSD